MSKEYLIIDKGNLPEKAPDLETCQNGIVIPLNKPREWTSSDAVRKIKFKIQRFYNQRGIKVGHAGTLDPLATGLLLICIGRATKQSEKLQAEKKEYVAEITFGATTPSFDLEKEIDFRFPYEHITLEEIKKCVASFIGEQEQIPPIFSAKFVDGVRAYEMARAGEEVKMKSSTITIYNMEVLEYTPPKLTLTIECSKGTYIRSIARDLGVQLNSGGYLSSLIRSSSGDFKLQDALTLDDIEKIF